MLRARPRVPGGGALRKLDTRDQAISYERPHSTRSQQGCQVPVRVATRLLLLTRRLHPREACGATRAWPVALDEPLSRHEHVVGARSP